MPRIIYADYKHDIEEPKQPFPTVSDAVAALDNLFSQGLALFGQVLDSDGRVLVNKAPLKKADTNPSGAQQA